MYFTDIMAILLQLFFPAISYYSQHLVPLLQLHSTYMSLVSCPMGGLAYVDTHEYH